MADGPFTSIVWFKVKPGMNAEFEKAFADCGMLERPRVITGYRGAVLHRAMARPDEYYVLGTWDSPADYEAWHDIAQSDAPRDALARLAATIDKTTAGTLVEPL